MKILIGPYGPVDGGEETSGNGAPIEVVDSERLAGEGRRYQTKRQVTTVITQDAEAR